MGLYFSCKLRLYGVRANDTLSGTYDYGNALFSDAFPTFLLGLRQRPLIYCHPGFVDEELRAISSLSDARDAEYRFLASDDFASLLKNTGTEIVRFSELA